tara:strand:- start:4 stop:225 length:222 start_codon:yes stop_codon:yes gene_type:complete
MELSIEVIRERKVALQGDIKELRETISQLDTKRQELVSNLNALSGADQQCDHFLLLLEGKEEEPKTKKKNENI